MLKSALVYLEGAYLLSRGLVSNRESLFFTWRVTVLRRGGSFSTWRYQFCRGGGFIFHLEGSNLYRRGFVFTWRVPFSWRRECINIRRVASMVEGVHFSRAWKYQQGHFTLPGLGGYYFCRRIKSIDCRGAHFHTMHGSASS